MGILKNDTEKSFSERTQELELKYLEKEYEDRDLMRNTRRRMVRYSLFGMLSYPVLVILASWYGLSDAANLLGDMAGTYFVAVAGIVTAFFTTQAYSERNKK